MEQQKDGRCGLGHLPSPAPMAYPYVPYQRENPPKYEARKGLVRGTLFPGLDLPFMGMVNRQEKPDTPKTELQALGLAVQELTLYLDTHPGDREALELLRSYQRLYRQCQAEYAEKYGPLNNTDGTNAREYRWLDDPWPWEFAANKEA